MLLKIPDSHMFCFAVYVLFLACLNLGTVRAVALCSVIIFSSPELKAQVSYSDRPLSVCL
jgi:hypothetical protein